MIPLAYERATDVDDAVRLAERDGAKYLGGGTNLVDLLRETVERPTTLIDVSALDGSIEERADGSLRIGASVRNTDVADYPVVRARFPMLARAIVAGASGQIRNMATVGGNILQRTRCTYFYDVEGSRCNKREPGQGCDAIGGSNRIHAVLGTSESCIATHPSDMCIALAALNAVVQVVGPQGRREIPLVELHTLPGERPDRETVLEPGELITAVDVPALDFAAGSTYRKVRDRASYAFALVSVAAALDVADGTVRDVRLGLGGVATKPWRAMTFERELRGQPATLERVRAAAEAEFAAAQAQRDNAFKIELGVRTIVSVFGALEGMTA